MANIKSAKKGVLVIKTKTLKNKMNRTQLKTLTKKFEAAVASGDKVAAKEAYVAVVKKIDRFANHGLVHPNCAARKKSQFTKALSAM